MSFFVPSLPKTMPAVFSVPRVSRRILHNHRLPGVGAAGRLIKKGGNRSALNGLTIL